MASKRRQEFKQSVCFACKKSIDLNVMGESALVSHMKGKKHEEYVKNLQGNEKTTKIGDFFSGAPAHAKRALDRAPYSLNMVNLFSFGCHLIDQAYVRTYVRVYRLYGLGRGGYQKEGRGVSGVSWQVHIFYIGHSQYSQLAAVKTG